MLKDLGLLVTRTLTGLGLISHGYPKLFGGEGRTPPDVMTRLYGKNFPEQVAQGGPEKLAGWLESMQVPNPRAAAYAAGLAELGGGLALLAGFQTRLAALVVLLNMATAARKAHWEQGFAGQGGYELAALYAGAAAALLVSGPGAFSVDGMVSGARRTARATSSAATTITDRASDLPLLRG